MKTSLSSSPLHSPFRFENAFSLEFSMLASLLAPYITGRYDVTLIPISLPSPLVTILLPSIWGDGAPIFLNKEELEQAGLGNVPSAGEGKNWAFVQVGEQISTGVGFGPGRKTF